MAESATAQNQQLREQNERLRLAAENALLEQQVRQFSLVNSLAESWGDGYSPAYANRTEFLDDDPTFGSLTGGNNRFTRPEDRKHGDNYPWWRTENELAYLRGIGRAMADGDEVAISALDNLASYIAGDGFDYQVTPLDDSSAAVAEFAQRAIDQFLELNDWRNNGESLSDCVQPDLERELIIRSRRDGEAVVTLEYIGGLNVRAETCEPDDMTEPDTPERLSDWLGLPSLDWKYGVAKVHNRPQQVVGYFVQRFGDRNDWEFYSPDRPEMSTGQPALLAHIKINVDRVVSRGFSDFASVYKRLESASKLLDGTVSGATIQSYIAYIREHSPQMTEAQISGQNIVDLQQRMSTPKGGRTVSARKMQPGTVIDTNGTTYKAGPLGNPKTYAFVEAVQAAYRVAGIRWNFPEYMISGDASNANYASTLVAGSPFVRSATVKQAFYRRCYGNVAWKVLRILVHVGAFSQFGINRFDELRKAISVAVEPTSPIDIKDKGLDHQIATDLTDRGIMSPETLAIRSGLDYQEEIAKGAKPNANPQPFTPIKQATSTGGGQPNQLPRQDPAEATESWRRLNAASQILWEGYPA